MYDLYECNEDDSSRFILGKNGLRKIFVVGLNPSTANREQSDITVAKVERVASDNGFDGFVMTNLYPLRSTNPKNLPQKHKQSLSGQNIESIIEVAATEKQPTFWAAWGSDITLRSYLLESLKNLKFAVERINGSWVQYGELTKSGHPRHPSRISYQWCFKTFLITHNPQLI